MKRIKIRTFAIFAVAALSGAMLLHTSQRVQEAEETLASLNAEIVSEQDTMRVLRAEWEYLNRPERLERLATEFLDLVPPAPKDMPDSMVNEASSLPEREALIVDDQLTQPVSYEAEQIDLSVENDVPMPRSKPKFKPAASVNKPVAKSSAKTSRAFDAILDDISKGGVQ